MTAPLRERGYASAAPQNTWWPDTSEQVPELRWPDCIGVYDRMRRQDAQVRSVLRAVSLPILRTTWRVDPAGARPEVFRPLAEDLGLSIVGEAPRPSRRSRGISWSEHLRHALTMLPFGFSAFEQNYVFDGELHRLTKLGFRPQATIKEFKVARDGGLDAVVQRAPGFMVGKDITLPIDRLVVYVNDREGGNWMGTSLLRPAFKFWLLKDRALRTGAISLERNGQGVPTYEAGPVPESITGAAEILAYQKTEMQEGLELASAVRSGEDTGASLRNGAKLRLQGVEGKLPSSDELVRYYDEQIARAVLAHFLNLGTETGSWALGSVLEGTFTMSLQTVALDLADTANRHVVEDWVDTNFGPDEPAPRLVFEEIGSRRQPSAEAIKLLIDAGVLEPDARLEDFSRELYVLPPKDIATARPAPAPTPSPAPAPQTRS